MGIKQVEDIIDHVGDSLTDEEAFYLWERWKRHVKRDAISAWQDAVLPFAEYAASSGFRLGMSVLRRDTSLPFGPDNCFFGYGRTHNAESANTQRETNSLDADAAANWNRKVYEPNREIVAQYKRRHGIPEERPQEDSEKYDSGSCAWCHDEFCVNGDCPARGDYCPTENSPGLCRFDSRGPRSIK